MEKSLGNPQGLKTRLLGEVGSKRNLSLGKETNLIIAVLMPDTRAGTWNS